MKFWIIFLGLCLLCNISSAQISRHINYDDIKANPPEHGWIWGRYFWGSFDLESLPAPLKPTKVNFTLEAVHGDAPGREGQDWEVKLFAQKDFVRILGDTLFYWPGPHKAGDIYSNSFEFMPLVSGLWGISLEAQGTRENISMYWCLDIDGKLHYLGRENASRLQCTNTRIFYFNQDSVYLSRHYNSGNRRDFFDYEIMIKPTPKIGDTSIIHYKFISANDITSNLRTQLEGVCMDFPSIPDKPGLPISKGQTLDFFVEFVPTPVNCRHQVGLTFTEVLDYDKVPTRIQNLNLFFIFNNDRTLRYVNNSGMKLLEDRLPTEFEEKSAKHSRNVITLSNGD